MLAYRTILASRIDEYSSSCAQLEECAKRVDPVQDIKEACHQRGTGDKHPPQVLYVCYEGDLGNAMAPERRIRRLEEKIAEFEREVAVAEKTLAGVVGLADVYRNTPSFADEKGKMDVMHQIANVCCAASLCVRACVRAHGPLIARAE